MSDSFKKVVIILRMCGLIVVLLFLLCAKRDGFYGRSNPFDPGGMDWRFDGKPDLSIQVEHPSLWSDFNFDDSTGMITVKYSMHDVNVPYDVATLTVLSGTSLPALKEVATITDTGGEYIFTGLKRSTHYYCQFIARDSWDSSVIISDSFTTPGGIPPSRPKVRAIIDTTFGVILDLSPNISKHTCIWRSENPVGPYRIVKDTQYSSSNRFYYDTLNDYHMRYYRIGAMNESGVSLSGPTLFGHRIAFDSWAPTGVTVFYPDSHHVTISWVSSGVGVAYALFRADSANGIFALRGNTKSTQFSDTLLRCSRYFYRIASVKDDRMSRLSAAVTLSPPPSPDNLKATNGVYTDRVHLSWSSVPTACGYNVYRGNYSYSTDPTVIIGTSSKPVFDDFLDSACNFYYKVSAFNLFGDPGPFSSTVQGSPLPLEIPASVSASQGLCSRMVKISWSPVKDCKSYIVYHGLTSGGVVFPLDTIESTGFEHTINDGLLHYYAVSSFISNVRSRKSSVTMGYALRLPAPSGVNATRGTVRGAVQIIWNAATNAKRYYIFRSDSGSTHSYTLIDSVTTLTYSDSVSTAAEYYYQIAAGTSTGDIGEHSSPASGYAFRNPPVTNLDASDGTQQGGIELSWMPDSMAKSYIVYRGTTSFGLFVKIAKVDGPKYIDLSIGSSDFYYYYKVSVVDVFGVEGVLSDYDRGHGKI